MAVAKIQGREKSMKIQQRKIQGPQVEHQARPIYIGQGRGWWGGGGAVRWVEWGTEHIKRGAKGPGISLPRACSLSSLCVFELCPHASRMYFPLFSKQN